MTGGVKVFEKMGGRNVASDRGRRRTLRDPVDPRYCLGGHSASTVCRAVGESFEMQGQAFIGPFFDEKVEVFDGVFEGPERSLRRS